MMHYVSQKQFKAHLGSVDTPLKFVRGFVRSCGQVATRKYAAFLSLASGEKIELGSFLVLEPAFVLDIMEWMEGDAGVVGFFFLGILNLQ